MVDQVSKTRQERAIALENWAESVEAGDLKPAETHVLRRIAELADERKEMDELLVRAVRLARQAERSWSEIGLMLGVSKQAAQRKYSSSSRAASSDNSSDQLNLTQRQRQVLVLVVDGLSNAEIANRLFVSRKTVSHHVLSICDKLGATSRPEVARIAKARDLLSN